MKRIFLIFIVALFGASLCSCGNPEPDAQIVTTILPIYEFTQQLCNDTDITVTQLVTEEISCLHDYTLQTNQMRKLENAQILILSGAGLESFLDENAYENCYVIDASEGIEPTHLKADNHHDEHHHEEDPHIWLSPAHCRLMAGNIADKLGSLYPEHKKQFEQNLDGLLQRFDALEIYAQDNLSGISSNQLITFHDGFSYMADAFGLHILHAVEEESGSEASAEELIHLIELVQEHNIQVIFTERNGSDSAAKIIAAETGADIFQLDMAISGESYFDAMYKNIDTLKEALE